MKKKLALFLFYPVFIVGVTGLWVKFAPVSWVTQADPTLLRPLAPRGYEAYAVGSPAWQREVRKEIRALQKAQKSLVEWEGMALQGLLVEERKALIRSSYQMLSAMLSADELALQLQLTAHTYDQKLGALLVQTQELLQVIKQSCQVITVGVLGCGVVMVMAYLITLHK